MLRLENAGRDGTFVTIAISHESGAYQVSKIPAVSPMWRICLICLIAACCGRLSSQAAIEPVTLRPSPEHPIIEESGANRLLNFDLMVSSNAEVPLRVSEVQMSVYDSGGHLALRKSLNTDAFAPSIEVIGERLLLPGHSLDIFNPFS